MKSNARLFMRLRSGNTGVNSLALFADTFPSSTQLRRKRANPSAISNSMVSISDLSNAFCVRCLLNFFPASRNIESAGSVGCARFKESTVAAMGCLRARLCVVSRWAEILHSAPESENLNERLPIFTRRAFIAAMISGTRSMCWYLFMVAKQPTSRSLRRVESLSCTILRVLSRIVAPIGLIFVVSLLSLSLTHPIPARKPVMITERPAVCARAESIANDAVSELGDLCESWTKELFVPSSIFPWSIYIESPVSKNATFTLSRPTIPLRWRLWNELRLSCDGRASISVSMVILPPISVP